MAYLVIVNQSLLFLTGFFFCLCFFLSFYILFSIRKKFDPIFKEVGISIPAFRVPYWLQQMTFRSTIYSVCVACCLSKTE